MKKSLEKDGGKQSVDMYRLNQKAFPGKEAFKKHGIKKSQKKIIQDCKDLEEAGFEC
jgi:hypothetical protein